VAATYENYVDNIILQSLRQMKMVSGEIVVAGRLAYVPQQPWIISASLRNNVLLGSEFNQDRSDQTMHCIVVKVVL